jgi:hypothetical protein
MTVVGPVAHQRLDLPDVDPSRGSSVENVCRRTCGLNVFSLGTACLAADHLEQ